ncbi:MAG: TrmH family RNA methyltransferase [Candidatus Dormibacteria bacterium]
MSTKRDHGETAPSEKEDMRNLVDYYKYVEDEVIRGDLDKRRVPLSIVCENFQNDINVAAVVRCANAFVAMRVHICGRRKFDRRGTVGTHHYEHLEFAPDTVSVIEKYRDDGYRIVAVENVSGSADIRHHVWVPKTLMLFGQEGSGITDLALACADDIVSIPQFGSVRSLNVGVAAGIAMYDYHVKLGIASGLQQE